VLYLGAITTSSYSVLAYSSWKVWWDLHNFRHDMSQATREMNIQLTKVLVAQAAIPLIFILAPFLLIFRGWLMAREGFSFCNKHIGLLMSPFISLVVVLDPLVTILIFPGYRRVLVRRFLCQPQVYPKASVSTLNNTGTTITRV